MKDIEKQKIRLFHPWIGEEEVKEITEVLTSGWIGLGPKTAEFEKEFANYIGITYAVGLNSCTASLDLALRALNIGVGDEVIVPTITFVSTAHVVVHNGATPVFCDVDPDTLLIDFSDLERKITSKTKAVIPVHLWGRMVDIEELQRKFPTLKVIEDCAHACKSTLRKRPAGTIGDIGCFSFHAVKNLAVGDGGMLICEDPQIAERVSRLRWLGINRTTWDRSLYDQEYWWEYDVKEIGFKCHMNDLSAAIGLAQLRKLEISNARRKEITLVYNNLLGAISEIKIPSIDTEDSFSSWHIYSVKTKRRNQLAEYLTKRGISVGVHYKPIHLYPCYNSNVSLPNAEKEWKSLLSLPIHPQLEEEEIKFICSSIKDFFRTSNE